jgi:hypothetical protein
MTGFRISHKCDIGNLPPSELRDINATTRHGKKLERDFAVKKAQSFFPRLLGRIYSSIRTLLCLPKSRKTNVAFSTSPPGMPQAKHFYPPAFRNAGVEAIRNYAQFANRANSTSAIPESVFLQLIDEMTGNYARDLGHRHEALAQAQSQIVPYSMSRTLYEAHRSTSIRSTIHLAYFDQLLKTLQSIECRDGIEKYIAAHSGIAVPENNPYVLTPAYPLAAYTAQSTASECFNMVDRAIREHTAVQTPDLLATAYCNEFSRRYTVFRAGEAERSLSHRSAIAGAHGLALAAIQNDFPESLQERVKKITETVWKHFGITPVDAAYAKDWTSVNYGGLRPVRPAPTTDQ